MRGQGGLLFFSGGALRKGRLNRYNGICETQSSSHKRGIRMMKLAWTMVGVGCLLAASTTAFAGVTAQVTLAGSSATSVAIDPNITTTFSVDVSISVSPETILSSEMLLTAGTGNVVQIVSGSYGPDWDPSLSLAIPVGAVNPNSVAKFGAVPLSPPEEAPRLSGNYLLATLDLQIVPGTSAGEYTLNVSSLVTGDADTFQNIGGDAGSAFTLTVLPPAAAPAIVSAVSRKTHGGAGSFDVDLVNPLPSQAIAVECRTGGPSTVVVTFDQPIAGVDGLDNSDVSLTSTAAPGTVDSVLISDTQLTIQMSGVASVGRIKLAFPGIANAAGAYALATGTICCGVLLGDGTGDGTANVFDLVTCRNVLGASVTSSNFRNDVTTDGSVNVFDLVSIRNSLGTSIPGACP